MACVRKVELLSHTVKKGIWDFKIAKPIFRLRNMKLGLVGFGNIARVVSQKAQVFGLKVIAYQDLGTEAIHRYLVKDFPAIVCIDAAGNNLYESEPPKFRKA